MFTVNPPRALWALLAALLALALFMNGVAMMGAPLSWYGFVPGVAATGPFNEHFVSDVGAAYVAGKNQSSGDTVFGTIEDYRR